MICLSILCLFYIFAFLCFVVLCFVIDPMIYSGLEVIQLEIIPRLKIKRNDWLFDVTDRRAAGVQLFNLYLSRGLVRVCEIN